MGRKALTIPSLIASLIGTLLLFYGLQITSLPNIQLGVEDDGTAAVCWGDDAIFKMGPNGNPHNLEFLQGQRNGCPKDRVPMAVISGDHPYFIRAGLLLIIVSTVLNLVAEARERTLKFTGDRAERRRQMKLALKPRR